MLLRDYEIVLRAVADPTRVRILKLLEGGELCVCQVVSVLGLGQSTVSRHLSILRQANLIEDRKEGKWVYYRLATSGLNQYNSSILSLLRLWLNDDHVIAADAKRLGAVRKVPLEKVCQT